ncbi:MAG TPA: proton-conducting transporter membrane subunit, partial [Neisseria sp.]|nr:proton-conducting transporter membrane subunit [Neisseria sp.]
TTVNDWTPMLAILAVASLLVGNLAAIMQSNIKRMLAYSTVSHMGFILLAFMAGAIGFTAGLYYAIAYVVM